MQIRFHSSALFSGLAAMALTLLASLALSQTPANPDENRLPEYTLRRVARPLKIDGKLDEPEWFAAAPVGEFVFPWWKQGKKERTCAKLLWDDEFLYIGVICEDAHITARHTERDGKIAEDDCFEIMLAPDADKPNVYFNIEFNVLGGIIDNFRPDGPAKPRPTKWDAEGVRIAGTYAGTLNDDRDTDQFWQVEVAIPLKNFARFAKEIPPRAGTTMRVNLNRSGGKTNAQYSQWSRGNTPTPSFHTPDRFGHMIFSAETALLDGKP